MSAEYLRTSHILTEFFSCFSCSALLTILERDLTWQYYAEYCGLVFASRWSFALFSHFFGDKWQKMKSTKRIRQNDCTIDRCWLKAQHLRPCWHPVTTDKNSGSRQIYVAGVIVNADIFAIDMIEMSTRLIPTKWLRSGPVSRSVPYLRVIEAGQVAFRSLWLA